MQRDTTFWSAPPTKAVTTRGRLQKGAQSVEDGSDWRSQYAGHAFQTRLGKYGMTCSMSRKGNCWDNAPTESFVNSSKNERVHGTRYATRDEAIADLFAYIEVFYNDAS